MKMTLFLFEKYFTFLISFWINKEKYRNVPKAIRHFYNLKGSNWSLGEISFTTLKANASQRHIRLCNTENEHSFQNFIFGLLSL